MSLSKVIKAEQTKSANTVTKSITLKTVTTLKEAPSLQQQENKDYMRSLREAKQKAMEVEKQAYQLKNQAVHELEDARQKISEEEENSKLLIHEAYDEAQKKGFEEGFEKGRKEGQQTYEEAIEEARHVITKAKKEYEHYLSEAEPVILNLALEVARRIVETSFESSEDLWNQLVKQALEEVKENEEITIYVSPSHYEQTRQIRKELEKILGHAQELMIFPDSSLSLGSCIIETPYGKVDASLDSQFNEIKSVLMEQLKE
ncbi:flagellar assembly protein FliH [Alteribacillus iranensis]|uniref:Flagellar assembly protein FliH n=1 Tax=Alteribacillus iranensis TaxID=930128 RepID=A0A1I2A4R2_9BACI|nr:flagellar assembly protein FliH [Alteribacillus iranensis]